MRNELQQIEEIENYLTGNMDAQEELTFENKMMVDDELSQRVNWQRQFMNNIQLNAFKAEINRLHNDLVDEVTKPWWRKGIYLNSFFATITVLISCLAAYFILFSNENKSNSKKNDRSFSNELSSEQQKKEDHYISALISDENDPVVHKENSHKKSNVSLNPFLVAFESQIIESGRDQIVQFKDSKSFVYIPANILEDQNGVSVIGNVEIRYREYRNSAQTAFSGIPMTYNENETEYNFNSVGMFEIQAFQDGKKLNVKNGKSFSVDYNVTEQVDDCYFFALNEQDNKWVKKHKIDFNKETKKEIAVDPIIAKKFNEEREGPGEYDFGMLQGRIKNALNGENVKKAKIKVYCNQNTRIFNFKYSKRDSLYQILNLVEGRYSVKITAPGYKTIRLKGLVISNDKISELNFKMVAYGAPNKDKIRGSYELLNGNLIIPKEVFLKQEKKRNLMKKELVNVKTAPVLFGDSIEKIRISRNGNANTLLSPGANAGHTYPNLVKGLNCSNFGVYNCDQIYLVKDRLDINAQYIDEDGKSIENGFVLSMIDLKFNGAFSFEPSSFNCSKSGRNVLLLFTLDKKLYALSEGEYLKMHISKNGNQIFKMRDLSKNVKNTKDLKVFLGLR